LIGSFIAFEGIDGSGKSSALQAVADALRERGLDVVETREPGGTEPGRLIRRLVLDEGYDLAAETELFLMCADRAEHVSKVLRPALARGAIVLSDRYAGSTRAYQGYGLGIDLALVDAAISLATGGLCPDCTILFDVDPAVAFSRRSGDPNKVNALDLRDLAFRERVREGFLTLAEQAECWYVIDAAQAAPAVVEQATRIAVSTISARQASQ
jgi:dTMP kinase